MGRLHPPCIPEKDAKEEGREGGEERREANMKFLINAFPPPLFASTAIRAHDRCISHVIKVGDYDTGTGPALAYYTPSPFSSSILHSLSLLFYVHRIGVTRTASPGAVLAVLAVFAVIV